MKDRKLRNIIREEIQYLLAEQDGGEPKLERVRKIEHLNYYPDGNTGIGSAPKLYRRIEFMNGDFDWRRISGYANESPKPIEKELADELERVYQNNNFD